MEFNIYRSQSYIEVAIKTNSLDTIILHIWSPNYLDIRYDGRYAIMASPSNLRNRSLGTLKQPQ